MLRVTEKRAVTTDVRTRVARFLDGPVDVADSWLESSGNLALLEESARAPDDDQAARLAKALVRCGEQQLVGVATEDYAGTDEVYELAPTEADLCEFAYARSGLNYALLPASGLRWVVLCTTWDFLLIAGPRELVRDFAGSPARVADEFRAFISGDRAWEHPTRRRLLRHFDWTGGG